MGSVIESETSVVQTSNVDFTSKVSDYLVVHTGPGDATVGIIVQSENRAAVCPPSSSVHVTVHRSIECDKITVFAFQLDNTVQRQMTELSPCRVTSR